MALFYIDWKDIQQDVALPNAGFDFETNVGKARSYGIEFETRAKVTDALTLTAAAAFTNATFREDMPALGADGDGKLNVRKGDRIQGVPRYNASLGFEYGFAAFGDGHGFVRGNAQWVGSSIGTFVKDSSDHIRPGYVLANLSAGIGLGGWEFTAFVKNLTNNDKVIQRPDVQGVATVFRPRPRTVGLTASMEF